MCYIVRWTELKQNYNMILIIFTDYFDHYKHVLSFVSSAVTG